MSFVSIPSLPDCQWQETFSFPDWKGYVDDTLAMNCMGSFFCTGGQGTLYLRTGTDVQELSLFINGNEIPVSEIKPDTNYRLNFSALRGINTLQLSGLEPEGSHVEVFVPYPVIASASLQSEEVDPDILSFLSDLIQADVEDGFPGAQLAIIRHGHLVYEQAWGWVNSRNPDGSPLAARQNADTDTLYDLASVTKMLSVNYLLSFLITGGRIHLDTTVAELFGEDFLSETLSFSYQNGDPCSPEDMRVWKASITLRDVLCHQAGYPADPQYHNPHYDACAQKPGDAENPLYCSWDKPGYSRQDCLHALFRTPLLYRPGTRTLYSDADYILLGFVIEAVMGMPLDRCLQEVFLSPLGLRRTSFTPLAHGFSPSDCAATELNGNTRDGRIFWPSIRTYTLQGEVHDEKAWYALGGISGHAGLFSCAREAAILGSLMLTGGHGASRFFSRDVMDLFSAPKKPGDGNWGLGWFRQGDLCRPWYFGTQAGSFTIGHQGWTGTLLMIDPQRQLVLAYLTNKLNTPVIGGPASNRFLGSTYTASTLGFVPQILSLGIDSKVNPAQLTALKKEMERGKKKLQNRQF